MTQQQKRSIGKWGGVAVALAAVFGLLSILWKPTVTATGIATQDYVQRTIGDTIRAHRIDDQPWRDDMAGQMEAIRCNVDSTYRTRHADLCAWRVKQ